MLFYSRPPKGLKKFICSEWGRLTREELDARHADGDKFYDAVSRKYGLTYDEVHGQLRQWQQQLAA